MTLDAREWIERSAVDAGVPARWPDHRVILLAADDFDVTSLASTTEERFAEAHALARRLGADEADPQFLDAGGDAEVAVPSHRSLRP